MADMGRPPIEIDRANFEKLCAMCATREEIAGFFECSHDTILRFCKNTYDLTFQEAFAIYSAKRKISLRRKQFEIAEDGNVTMCIWLGKQYLGQTDKQDLSVESTKPILFSYALPDEPPKAPDEVA
jgi:hypothetical protein